MKWNIRPSAMEMCSLSLEDDLLDSRAVLARASEQIPEVSKPSALAQFEAAPSEGSRTAAALSAAEWKQSQISLFRTDTFYFDS